VPLCVDYYALRNPSQSNGANIAGVGVYFLVVGDWNGLCVSNSKWTGMCDCCI